jgi:KTSC domain
MERQAVKSGALQSVGYDEATRTLEIEMANGGVYQYQDVPPEAHQGFLQAESLGKHFQSSIRGSYRFVKVA